MFLLLRGLVLGVVILVVPLCITFAGENRDTTEYYHSLGDTLRKEGRLTEALKAYEKARALDGKDKELLKHIGTVEKWLREFRAAETSFKEALRIDPEDREAREDLKDLRLRRGIRIWGWIGGYEPDYTTESYETMFFYGGLDSMDIYGGYGYSDQVYYTRQKIYGKGYYFYTPYSYIKGAIFIKDYNYPEDETGKPNPDSNSYDKVPSIEIEASHLLIHKLRATLAYEYFAPTFFYDQDTRASNYKISGEVEFPVAVEGIKGSIIYARLHDPDPDRTRIKGRPVSSPAASTEIVYRNTSLLGGSIKYDRNPWEIKLKYFPNRDLDNSYKYSFLTSAEYDFTRRFTGRIDHVFDKYSSESNFTGKTANVYMISASYEWRPDLKIGGGYKYIDIPRGIEHTGFVTITYKTGFWF